MRIDNVNNVELNKVGKSDNTKVDNKFAFTLQSHIAEGELTEKLTQMSAAISKQGSIFAEHMDLHEFKKYKNMISEFMNEIVSTSHKFSRENFLDRRGRHKVYGLIRLVNKDVDDIAQELINNEKNHMMILGKLDEIRGLLLDIIT